MEEVTGDIVDYAVNQQLHIAPASIAIAIATTIDVTIDIITITIDVTIDIIAITIDVTIDIITITGLSAVVYAFVVGVQGDQIALELFYPWKAAN